MGIAAFLVGCHQLTPAQQARLDAFQCRAAAIAPLCEPAIDAAELVRTVYAGRSSLAQVLGALMATQEETAAMAEAWNRCTPEVKTELQALPPLYGNELL